MILVDCLDDEAEQSFFGVGGGDWEGDGNGSVFRLLLHNN